MKTATAPRTPCRTFPHTGPLPHPAGRSLRPPGPSELRLVPPPEPRPVSLTGALRLTGRGRAVALVALLAAIFGLGLAFGASAIGADAARAPDRGWEAHAVQPGQTLWGIARELAPARDPRLTIAELVAHNRLPSAQLQSGQVLLVPSRAR